MIDGNKIDARAIVGFYPCNSDDQDDIEIYEEDGTTLKTKFCTLRQQLDKDQDNFLALSDFVAPKSAGKKDYMGFFSCSAGHGQEEMCEKLKEDNDDYQIMMVKTLTDRLAEAFAEHLHQEVRTNLWGYAPNERLSVQECINVKYQGIRPAPGYPT